MIQIRRFAYPALKLIGVIGVLLMITVALFPLGVFILDDSPPEYSVRTTSEIDTQKAEAHVGYAELSQQDKQVVDTVIDGGTVRVIHVTNADVSETFSQYSTEFSSWEIVVSKNNQAHILEFENENSLSHNPLVLMMALMMSCSVAYIVLGLWEKLFEEKCDIDVFAISLPF